MPAIDLISVDLPAPLSPTSAITSPARTSKSAPRRACTEPNDFVTPRSSRSGVVAAMRRVGGASRDAPPAILLRRATYLQYFAYFPTQTWLFFRNPSANRSL